METAIASKITAIRERTADISLKRVRASAQMRDFANDPSQHDLHRDDIRVVRRAPEEVMDAHGRIKEQARKHIEALAGKPRQTVFTRRKLTKAEAAADRLDHIKDGFDVAYRGNMVRAFGRLDGHLIEFMGTAIPRTNSSSRLRGRDKEHYTVYSREFRVTRDGIILSGKVAKSLSKQYLPLIMARDAKIPDAPKPPDIDKIRPLREDILEAHDRMVGSISDARAQLENQPRTKTLLRVLKNIIIASDAADEVRDFDFQVLNKGKGTRVTGVLPDGRRIEITGSNLFRNAKEVKRAVRKGEPQKYTVRINGLAVNGSVASGYVARYMPLLEARYYEARNIRFAEEVKAQAAGKK